jgi:hypothetical protein
MSLLFSNLANTIHKFERLAKVFERVRLLQVMVVNYLPSLDLTRKPANFLACQRRHATTTRHALAFG